MTPSDHSLRQYAKPTVAQNFGVAALVAAPVFFVAGQALLPPLGDDFASAFAGMIEHRDQLLASRLLTAAGAFLFLLTAAPIAFLVPRGSRGSGLLRLGITLYGVGTFANGLGEVVHGYATYAATAADVPREAGGQVILGLDQGLVTLPISYWSIPLFGIGLLLTAVALLVSRRVGVWRPLVLLVGLVLGFSTAGLGWISAVTNLPLIIGFASLAPLAVQRRSAGDLAPVPAEVHDR